MVGQVSRRTSCTSQKLHGPFFLIEPPPVLLLAFDKNLSLRHQKKTPSLVLSTPRVTWNGEKNVKFFKMVDKIITKNIA